MGVETRERKLAAILSADVAGYSRLMAEDEDDTVRRLTAYRTEIANLVADHRGRVVDFTGDNFLAEFPTATDAVEAAAEIQRVIKARDATAPAGRAMEFRIGVHLGEVRVEGECIYGDGVNIAARLEALADAGGICISGEVHGQVLHKLHVECEDLGEQQVKNIPDSVRVFRVRLDNAPGSRQAESRTGRSATISTVGVVVLAAGVAIWWLLGDDLRPSRQMRPIRSLAVLPLEDLSHDQAQQYFADGMTEALTGDLAKISSLRVISRTSATNYRKTSKSLPQIAGELNVDAIIEGSVLRAEDRVRISVQLIHGVSDDHLWAGNYERKLSDIIELQSDVARSIAAEIRVFLKPDEEKRLGTAQNVEQMARETDLKGGTGTGVRR